MKNILVNIKSDIDQLDGEKHNIEMISEGHAYIKNGSLFIVYHETELSGMEGCKTMLKLQGNTVTMTRFGESNSKMIFDEHQKMTSRYKTPYGDFEMVIETKSLKNTMDINTLLGHIDILYSMTLEGVSNSINHIEIKVSDTCE